VVLAGCGGDDTGSAAGTGTSSPAAATPAGGPSTGTATAQEVPVTARDFSFTLPATTFTPGSYTFVMSNDGSATHPLALEGPGVADAKSDAVGSGGTASLTVDRQAATCTLFCPIGNHRAMGMQTQLTVG
jgi:plastocyanin